MYIFCLSVLPSAFPDLTCWLTRILLWSFAGTSSKDRTWDELSLYVLWNEKRGLRTEMATLQDVQKTYANGSVSETPFSTHKAL